MFLLGAEGGTSPWEVGLVVLTVIGGLAAMQQLWSWVVGRRHRQAQERLLEAFADKIDAQAAQAELEGLRGLAASLERQVQEEIPRAARRAFLRQERDAISASISDQYRELRSIEIELSEPESHALRSELRAVIEDRLIRSSAIKERSTRTLTVVVGAILLLLLLPINADYLVRWALSALSYSYEYHPPRGRPSAVHCWSSGDDGPVGFPADP